MSTSGQIERHLNGPAPSPTVSMINLSQDLREARARIREVKRGLAERGAPQSVHVALEDLDAALERAITNAKAAGVVTLSDAWLVRGCQESLQAASLNTPERVRSLLGYVLDPLIH